jgi:hypothetical protein
MIVRKANLNDLAPLLEFGRRHFEASNFAPLKWNGVIARRTLKDAMVSPNSRVFIAMKNGNVVGALIGDIYMMPFSAAMCATDIAFVADAGGDMLLDAFLEWCKTRKVKRIDMGVSQEDPRVDNLYKRKGFIPSGTMFYMNLEEPT